MAHRTVLLAFFAAVLGAGGPETAPPEPANVRQPEIRLLPKSETLHYTVEWRLITAGKARLSWTADPAPDRRGWQTRLHLQSTGIVSKLFKVNDSYTSLLEDDLCALSSHIIAQEGRRNRETKVTYDAAAGKANRIETDLEKNAVINKQEIDVPACVHDVVGALFVLRALNLKPGEHAEVPVSDGKKLVWARVEAQQREQLKTPSGTYKTIRYEAFLFNNVLYRRSGHLYIWLSDDDRRIPAQIQARLRFTTGTITLQLEKVEKPDGSAQAAGSNSTLIQPGSRSSNAL